MTNRPSNATMSLSIVAMAGNPWQNCWRWCWCLFGGRRKQYHIAHYRLEVMNDDVLHLIPTLPDSSANSNLQIQKTFWNLLLCFKIWWNLPLRIWSEIDRCIFSRFYGDEKGGKSSKREQHVLLRKKTKFEFDSYWYAGQGLFLQ